MLLRIIMYRGSLIFFLKHVWILSIILSCLIAAAADFRPKHYVQIGHSDGTDQILQQVFLGERGSNGELVAVHIFQTEKRLFGQNFSPSIVVENPSLGLTLVGSNSKHMVGSLRNKDSQLCILFERLDPTCVSIPREAVTLSERSATEVLFSDFENRLYTFDTVTRQVREISDANWFDHNSYGTIRTLIMVGEHLFVANTNETLVVGQITLSQDGGSKTTKLWHQKLGLFKPEVGSYKMLKSIAVDRKNGWIWALLDEDTTVGKPLLLQLHLRTGQTLSKASENLQYLDLLSVDDQTGEIIARQITSLVKIGRSGKIKNIVPHFFPTDFLASQLSAMASQNINPRISSSSYIYRQQNAAWVGPAFSGQPRKSGSDTTSHLFSYQRPTRAAGQPGPYLKHEKELSLAEARKAELTIDPKDFPNYFKKLVDTKNAARSGTIVTNSKGEIIDRLGYHPIASEEKLHLHDKMRARDFIELVRNLDRLNNTGAYYFRPQFVDQVRLLRFGFNVTDVGYIQPIQPDLEIRTSELFDFIISELEKWKVKHHCSKILVSPHESLEGEQGQKLSGQAAMNPEEQSPLQKP